MSDLWAPSRERAHQKVAPLALRMRPRTLEEFAGQQHILGEGKLLRRMLKADAITSIILHGPPGTGKTTLAELIAGHTRRHFERENAASVGVKRIREIIDDAARRLEAQQRRTILFLDEIHRFTRAQQDVLLGDVERGLITLIGATTENPLFAVNSALVSRSTLFRLELLTEEEITTVLRHAISDPERGYGKINLTITDDALHVWATKSDGDARRALTALEVAVLSSQSETTESPTSSPPSTDGDPAWHSRRGDLSMAQSPGRPQHGTVAGATSALLIDRSAAEDSIQQKAAVYDTDEHYDVASALIKSIRGSDPDAAVYWIARMLEGGEDPRFIARRLAILASEDIGNADPRAIMITAAAWQLVERIGMPEARITLAQAATYLALAPKSNASYTAIDEALADVREGRTIPVPMYLRDPHSPPPGESGGGQPRGGEVAASTPGKGYIYSHAVPGAVTGQDYLGIPKSYYRPGDAGLERALADRLEQIRRLRNQQP